MAFERVTTEAELKGKVRKEFAWTILSDYSKYPQIMENVDDVKILERDGVAGKSEWFVTIEGAPLTWIEKDFFDVLNFEIHFESINGDFDNINGTWRVEDLGGEGIKIYFTIDYNLGIPVIEEVLGHILKEKMKSNIDSMIHAIKKELTKNQVEERKHTRYPIGKYNDLVLNGRKIRTYIVNISKGGILFYYEGRFDAIDVVIEFGSIAIEIEALLNNMKNGNSRLIYKKLLNQKQLDQIVDYLNLQNNR